MSGKVKINLTGQRFNRLTAQSYFYDANRKIKWLCICDCGNTTSARSCDLKSGAVMSCGCYNREKLLKHGHRIGAAQPPEYKAWASMKERCENPNNRQYKHYGGRGIKVCKKWADSYISFFEDMGSRPSPKHSLDRFPDNNGDYTPNNCRWATKEEQGRNKRTNAILTYNGKSLCVKEWSEITGITVDTLNYRREKKWAIDKILTMPMRNFKGRKNTK